MHNEKPNKKSDAELWHLISKNIEYGNYIFLSHAKRRLKDRSITDIEVINILEGKSYCKTKRNKKKDSYTPGYQDWNYCIEGLGLDNEKIRVIISFDVNLMLVITVIRLESSELYYE